MKINHLISIILGLMLALTAVKAFSIDIDPSITPEYTLNCAMPVEREDGTPLALDEIAEVTFYWGAKSGDYVNEQSNTVCQHVVDVTTLADGGYFYVVTAADIDGRRSLYSAEVVVTVKRVANPRAPTWLQ